MVRHTIDVESLSRSLFEQLQGSVGVKVNILPCADDLHGVAAAISEEADAHFGRILSICTADQGALGSDPSAIGGARDSEDVTLFVRGVMNNPTLSFAFVVCGGRGGSDFVTVAGGQSRAGLLEHKIAALGQVADTLLVAILEVKLVCHVALRTIWNGGPRVGVQSLAQSRTNVVTEKVSSRSFRRREVREREVRLVSNS